MKYYLLFLLIISQSVQASYQVKTNPVVLSLGGLNLDIGTDLHENISVSVGGMSLSATVQGVLNDVNIDAVESHLRTDYWLSGIFKQGWYLGVMYSKMTIDMELLTDTDNYTATIEGSGIIGMVGYHWQWDSFFMDLELQAGKYDFDDPVILTASDGSKEEEDLPEIASSSFAFNIGWVF